MPMRSPIPALLVAAGLLLTLFLGGRVLLLEQEIARREQAQAQLDAASDQAFPQLHWALFGEEPLDPVRLCWLAGRMDGLFFCSSWARYQQEQVPGLDRLCISYVNMALYSAPEEASALPAQLRADLGALLEELAADPLPEDFTQRLDQLTEELSQARREVSG